jgi:pimeloyl-ACP methyl ester carboxylesterase
MYDKLKYKGGNIAYEVKGQGKTIVLLHGYIESLNVWEEFSEALSKKYKVISIDLPGHGSSDTVSTVHTMKYMAETVNAVIEHLGEDKVFMIGHSMGGYVTMEFVENYSQKLEGYCLFHSTPLADTEEKKAVRERLIESIRSGKKVLLAKEHVEKTFAKENIEKYREQIGFLKVIAVNTTAEGTIAALEGMKLRADHRKKFSKSKIPVMWILGEKDNFIEKDIYKKIDLPEKIKIVFLSNSGHQGYIEEKEKSLEEIQKFVEEI